jgi:hypothetical protein
MPSVIGLSAGFTLLSAKKLAGTEFAGGGAKIVRPTVAVSLILFDEPVTVTLTVPGAAPLLLVKVSVLVPVVLEGLNDAVTPLGKFDAERATLPEKPLWGVTVIVTAPLAPC